MSAIIAQVETLAPRSSTESEYQSRGEDTVPRSGTIENSPAQGVPQRDDAVLG
jgi:hypothetical protein